MTKAHLILGATVLAVLTNSVL